LDGIWSTYIPSEYDENWPKRKFLDVSLKSLLRLSWCVLQNVFADLAKIFATSNSGRDLLSSVSNGTTHLFC